MTPPQNQERERDAAVLQDALETMADIIDLEWGEGAADEDGKASAARGALTALQRTIEQQQARIEELTALLDESSMHLLNDVGGEKNLYDRISRVLWPDEPALNQNPPNPRSAEA
jgi:hypothetical protein